MDKDKLISERLHHLTNENLEWAMMSALEEFEARDDTVDPPSILDVLENALDRGQEIDEKAGF